MADKYISQLTPLGSSTAYKLKAYSLNGVSAYSGATAANWVKFATWSGSCASGNDDTSLLLNISYGYYSANNYAKGILFVNFRGSKESTTPERKYLRWVVGSGIDPDKWVLTHTITNDYKITLNLYVNLDTAWQSYSIVKINEHSWGTTENKWELLNRVEGITAIPTNEIQLISSLDTISNNAITATALLSNAGNLRNPIYFSNGKPAAGAITFDTLKANRLMWTSAEDKPYAGYHYADSSHISIADSTLHSDYSLYVNGATGTMGNIKAFHSGTTTRSIAVENSNGTVDLRVSTNRGLYDGTAGDWLIYTEKSSGNTFIKNWASIGSGIIPISINSSGRPVASTSTVGTATKPIWMDGGTIKAGTYELKATINASENANRAAYYSTTTNIEDAGSIYMTASRLGVNATTYQHTLGGASSTSDFTFSVLGNGFIRDTIYTNTELRVYRVASGNAWRVFDDTVAVGSFNISTQGTTSQSGLSYITIGNKLSATTKGNARGRLYLGKQGAAWHIILGEKDNTTDNWHYLPDASGWVVTAGNGTSTGAGSDYVPVYVSASGIAVNVSENSVLTNLASTTAVSTYTGSPRPGVTGTLPVGHGGTGNTSFTKDTLIYANTATKLASYTSTKGGTKKLWYLNAGVPTDSAETVGATDKPVFLSSGTITESTSTIGSGIIPIYMASGKIKASTSTIGTFEKPVYLNAGTVTALNPVWLLSGGTATANNEDLNAAKYKVIGNYYSDGDAKSKTILNSPFGAAASTNCLSFTLKTEASLGTGTTYLRQLWRGYNSGVEAERTSTNSGSSWSTWRTKVFKNSDATTTQGNGEQPIYIAANGQAVNTTYHLKAHVEDGSASHLAYYSTARTIDYTPNIIYYNDNSVTTQGTTTRLQNGLLIAGQTSGNTASHLVSNTAGVMQFGDGGPQLIFSEATSGSPAIGSDAGAILFTNHDSAGTGSSFHFVGKNGNDNQGGNLHVTAPNLIARKKLTIGLNFINTSYTLYVNGTTKSQSNLFVGTKATYNDNNAGWYLGADGTMWGTHASSGAHIYLKDDDNSHYMEINPDNLTGNIRLSGTEDRFIMPKLNIASTADIGGKTSSSPPLSIGTLTSTHIEIDTNEILAKNSDTTTGVLYLQDQDGLTSVSGSQGLFVITTSKAWLAAHNASYVGGIRMSAATDNSGAWNWIKQENSHADVKRWWGMGTVGKAWYLVTSASTRTSAGRDRGILYYGDTGQVLFSDGTYLETGNLTIGGTSGTDAGKTIVSSSTLYLKTSTSSSIIFNTNSTNHARFDPSGHFKPESTNTYTLGISGTRWKSLFVGTADSYGDGEQPIYWAAGVPKATTYHLKANIEDGSANYLAYYSAARTIDYTPYLHRTNNYLYFERSDATAVGLISKNSLYEINFHVAASGNRGIYQGAPSGKWLLYWPNGSDIGYVQSGGLNVNGPLRSTYLITNYSTKTAWNDGKAGAYIGADGTIQLTHATGEAYIGLHRAGNTAATGYVQTSSDAAISLGGTAANLTYNSRTIATAVKLNGATYCSSQFETPAYFMVNGSAANGSRGFYLYNHQVQYARLFVSTVGTVATADAAGTAGCASLYLGNATAQPAAGATTAGANNAYGRILLYGTNTNYTILRSNPSGDRTMYLPEYGGTGYLVCRNTAGGVGAASTPVYIDANGCIQACTAYNSATNIRAATVNINNDTTSKLFVLGATTTGYTSIYRESSVYMQNNVLHGAAWNDYAEFRQLKENKMYAITVEPGRVVYENGDDTLSISRERLMRGCSIVSDTYGFGIGESEEAQLPIAVSGRVLAYPYENREEFKNHIGWPVCSGPNGTVSIMTEEEEMKYPSRIIGIISAVPDYEVWHGGADVIVDGRVWIKVR